MNGMDDDFDLDALKSVAAKATPRPDPATRAAHLRLAEKNFDALQGARDEARLNPARPAGQAAGGFWRGVSNMFNVISGKGALTLTTAIVAGGFLVLSPAGQDLWRGWQSPTLVNGQADDGQTVVGQTAVSQTAVGAGEDTRQRTEEQAVTTEIAQASIEAEQAFEPLAEMGAAPPQPAPPSPAFVAPVDMADSNMAVGALTRQAAPMGGAMPMADALAMPVPDTEAFANADENPLKVVMIEPVSTFSIDVDTASWAVVRQSLAMGILPPRDAVRVEELINYFPYDYAAPEGEAAAPFQPSITVMPTPWNADTQLVSIGIQGEMPAIEDRPPLNLVFLIDTSGSMEAANKLPLLRASFRLMVEQLRPEDQVAIVTYAGSAGLALEPTAAAERSTIFAALDNLSAGGSTAGQAGLQQAYAVAESMISEGDVTRVILATDGDFNVGASSVEAMENFISDKRDTGVFLSVLGFGRGNLNDALMQTLAQNGNGNAAYIDTMAEAQKVLVDELTGALFPIASDVKVQVEWNPALVAEYRLIGYETRALNREDFNNDRVDAGDLGAGHTVTAIYEITPVGSPAVLVDPLRYGTGAEPGAATMATDSDELGFLRLRWKEPGSDTSELLETPILPGGAISDDAQFAAAIAGFGQLLRGSDWTGDWGWQDAIALASAHRGEDAYGYRNEAVQMMRLAASLSAQ